MVYGLWFMGVLVISTVNKGYPVFIDSNQGAKGFRGLL